MTYDGTDWNYDPADYGITFDAIGGGLQNGDTISVVYAITAQVLNMTVNASQRTPEPAITATVNESTYIAHVGTPGTTTFTFTNAWSDDPADYGITVTGTPISGDEIVAVYTKTTVQEEVLDLSVIAPRTAPLPITAVIDRDTFVGYVGASGTITLSYTNAWSADPALYGITVSNTPVSGDEIVIVYVKASRGQITMSNPLKLVSTGWNLYNHTNGYARVLKYSDTYGFRVAGTYTKLEYSTTLTGSKTDITVTDETFTIPDDGYVWVTGGNDTDTAVYMTWSNWTNGYSGSFAAYSETGIDLTTLMSNRFPYGLMAVGIVHDEIDFITKQAVSRIQRIAYSDADYESAKSSGRAYDADESYIYLEKVTPDVYSIDISNVYSAFDHGMEWIVGSEVEVLVSVLYGQNLVDKLRHDVAVGPSSSTDGNIVEFNGTGGKLLKDSGKKVTDFADKTEAIKNITRDGTTFTVTRTDGTTFTFDQQDSNTTYSLITRGGDAGLAPGLPSGTGTAKYLREDGSWAQPPNDNTTYSAASGGGLSLSSGAFSLANSGVTAGSYGPSANATPGYGSTFNVPYITVDAKGRVTAASTKTVKIPASDNTNTWRGIQNNLTSTSTTDSLSAYQGKVLNEKKPNFSFTGWGTSITCSGTSMALLFVSNVLYTVWFTGSTGISVFQNGSNVVGGDNSVNWSSQGFKITISRSGSTMTVTTASSATICAFYV